MNDETREQYARTRLLLGQDGLDRLRKARVAVFGVGGVGGYVVEALARSGVGALDLIDDDKVCLSNLNRQIIATRSTLGMYKVDAAAARVRDIDPEIVVRTYKTFYTPETADQFDFTQYSYVVDAIDTVTGKLSLVMQAKAAGVPIICSMGAGNKLDPSRFEVADLYETSVCPLARVMRAGRRSSEGGLLQGAAPGPHRRGNNGRSRACRHTGPARHTQKAGPRLGGLRALGGGAGAGGRSDTGFERRQPKVRKPCSTNYLPAITTTPWSPLGKSGPARR